MSSFNITPWDLLTLTRNRLSSFPCRARPINLFRRIAAFTDEKKFLEYRGIFRWDRFTNDRYISGYGDGREMFFCFVRFLRIGGWRICCMKGVYAFSEVAVAKYSAVIPFVYHGYEQTSIWCIRYYVSKCIEIFCATSAVHSSAKMFDFLRISSIPGQNSY